MTKSILKKFVHDEFNNSYRELKALIDDGDIETLVDIQQELNCGSQLEVLERFETWVTGKFTRESMDDILKIIYEVLEDWNDYSDWVEEDTYYYLYIITDKEYLEYEIAHESTFVRSVERVVKIEFLN